MADSLRALQFGHCYFNGQRHDLQISASLLERRRQSEPCGRPVHLSCGAARCHSFVLLALPTLKTHRTSLGMYGFGGNRGSHAGATYILILSGCASISAHRDLLDTILLHAWSLSAATGNFNGQRANGGESALEIGGLHWESWLVWLRDSRWMAGGQI